MFIELTEILKCPRDHAESYVVAAPIAMDGRRIVRGVVGCPECRAEFPVVDGVVYFGAPDRAPAAAAAPAAGPEYDAAALAGFLGLEGPGGYAALVGRAARHGPALPALVPGVHVVAVNPPAGVAPGSALSVLRCPGGLPFKTRHLRAVALGADHAGGPWLAEAARVLLPGLRLVVEDEGARAAGVTELARGAGMFVGSLDR
ncbi:MAG TPA: hypothetical protein VEH62_11995 [Gemmatimonadales bacterium]|nr:hypothetical protein [Gemmatimonadales bacterium]